MEKKSHLIRVSVNVDTLDTFRTEDSLYCTKPTFVSVRLRRLQSFSWKCFYNFKALTCSSVLSWGAMTHFSKQRTVSEQCYWQTGNTSDSRRSSLNLQTSCWTCKLKRVFSIFYSGFSTTGGDVCASDDVTKVTDICLTCRLFRKEYLSENQSVKVRVRSSLRQLEIITARWERWTYLCLNPVSQSINPAEPHLLKGNQPTYELCQWHFSLKVISVNTRHYIRSIYSSLKTSNGSVSVVRALSVSAVRGVAVFEKMLQGLLSVPAGQTDSAVLLHTAAGSRREHGAARTSGRDFASVSVQRNPDDWNEPWNRQSDRGHLVTPAACFWFVFF